MNNPLGGTEGALMSSLLEGIKEVWMINRWELREGIIWITGRSRRG